MQRTAPPAKKNDEPQPVAVSNPATETMALRSDAAHAPEVAATQTNGTAETPTETISVLDQYKRAMAGGASPKPVSKPPRVSRREQLAQVAEQPFVKRAIELFNADPSALRYTPPEGEPN